MPGGDLINRGEQYIAPLLRMPAVQKAGISLVNRLIKGPSEDKQAAGHAEVWDQIRSLHVAECEVESAIDRALGKRPLGTLVDVGTGTGRAAFIHSPPPITPRSRRARRAKFAGSWLQHTRLR